MTAATGFAKSPTLDFLADALHRVGVHVVLLRANVLPLGGTDVELLVPPRGASAAMRVFDGMSWLYKLGSHGASRLFPMVHYWWADGLNLDVYWRLPAAPFPSRTLRPVERALWDRATLGSDGLLVPDASALLVHRACQAARPGRRYHRRDWDDFLTCRGRVTDWDRVWTVAREARVAGTVRRALETAEAGVNEPPSGPLFDGALGSAWNVAVAVQQRARPRSLGRFLAASSRLGEMTALCRVNGTEILSGPGVFVPTPDAELFVRLVLERLETVERPVVVEVGTGCGAIGLAIAQARPDAEVHLADLSHLAVWWTRRNRRALALRNVRVGRGSLLEPIGDGAKGRVTVMLANLPYYPAQRYAPIGGVPRDTIEGEGDDGLGLLRRLAEEAIPFLSPGGRLLLQMFAWQWETLAPELTALGYHPGEPTVHGPFAICPADRG